MSDATEGAKVGSNALLGWQPINTAPVYMEVIVCDVHNNKRVAELERNGTTNKWHFYLSGNWPRKEPLGVQIAWMPLPPNA